MRALKPFIPGIVFTILTLVLTGCQSPSSEVFEPAEANAVYQASNDNPQLNIVPQVDILFVIDDSRSMKNHISNLATNIPAFVDGFATHDQIDFHIGVTTVWDSIRYQDPIRNPKGIVPQFGTDIETGEKFRNFWSPGELLPLKGSNSKNRYVERSDNFKEVLKQTLLINPRDYVAGGKDEKTGEWVDGVGPEYEELFYPTWMALTNPQLNDSLTGPNKGFWRAGAHKVIVFVSDADDGSQSVTYDELDRTLRQLTGDNSRAGFSTYAVIHPPDKPSTEACKKDPSGEADKLKRFMDLTQGSVLNICSRFGPALAEIGEEIRANTLGKIVVPLSRYPEYMPSTEDDVASWLEVKYGETSLPLYSEAGWGWSWDFDQNAVIIRGADQLEYVPGAEFRIRFIALNLKNNRNSKIEIEKFKE